MTHPLQAFMDVRRGEWPLALAMLSYFFLVITSFWILKPLKKGLFIEYYDASGFSLLGMNFSAAQAELLAKVLNMVVAFVAVVVFSALSRHLRRERLSFVFCGFFLLCYALFGRWLSHLGDGTVWSFYLFGDLFSTLMVATFFAFLNDAVYPETARRLYGLVGLGGVAGGVFGSTIVRVNIDNFSYPGWLGICAVLAVLMVVAAAVAGRYVQVPAAASEPARPAQARSKTQPAPEPKPRTRRHGPATEGAALVFRSRYLMAVAAIVGLYEVISTIVDFQFTATVAHYLSGPAIGAQFALVFSITNWVSLLVQLFLTGLVMSRFGVGLALLVLPCTIAMGSAAFLVFPALWVGSLLNTADNGFSYSINQSAKEALYVPTTPAEKYRAKAFIDMFVQRFAKAVAVLISLGLTYAFGDFNSLRYLSLVTLLLLVVWVAAARYAGRVFRDYEEASDTPAP
ncbi:NTP/NDP exchange transporter [Parahaliea mediterranea]|uniref:NTP/NDP exchange transporter n=1 Tax=Parahaliea mediterranea TaxID=651086 RepID=UPI0013001834|nr:Npt1/Npt2 family nucleotide transporter [Parahaliea mediterranea]